MVQEPSHGAVDRDALRRRLLEAAAWCGRGELPGGLRSRLRTGGFQPADNDLWNVSCGEAGDFQTGHEKLRQARAAAVDHVGARRAESLHSEMGLSGLEGIDAECLRGGRLLAFDPDLALGEQLAMQWSSGFFDEDDCPPWDTWIWYSREDVGPCVARDILVCWVPGRLHAIAEEGMRGSVTGSLGWLDSPDFRLSRAADVFREVAFGLRF